MTLDPALRLALHLALALVFLVASVHKLRDLPAFSAALSGYRIVPEWMVPAVAPALAAAELLLALSLGIPGLGGVPALTAAAVLLLYGAAIGVNLARGRRHIDCGCAGPAARRPIHAGLVLRNLLLAGFALVSSLPADARVLHWVDLITIAGVVASGAALYAAADRVLAGAPRLATLKVRP